MYIKSIRYSCQILLKFELPRQVFKNSQVASSVENPSSGSRVVARGQTDRQTDTTRLCLFLQFYKRAEKDKNYFNFSL